MKVSSTIATQTQYYKYEEIIKMASTCNYTFYLKKFQEIGKWKILSAHFTKGKHKLAIWQ